LYLIKEDTETNIAKSEQNKGIKLKNNGKLSFDTKKTIKNKREIIRKK